jgi:hypothetical protein
MSIALDFDALELEGNASAIAHGSNATLLTVPLASAGWPLQSGRVALVTAEYLVRGSDDSTAAGRLQVVIPPGLAASTVIWFGSASYSTYTISAQFNNGGGTALGEIDSNGDLSVIWQNDNPNTVTEDAAVRVKVRWAGS